MYTQLANRLCLDSKGIDGPICARSRVVALDGCTPVELVLHVVSQLGRNAVSTRVQLSDNKQDWADLNNGHTQSTIGWSCWRSAGSRSARYARVEWTLTGSGKVILDAGMDLNRSSTGAKLPTTSL